MLIDDENNCIEWEGMPRSLELSIEKNYELLKAYPLMYINMALSGLMEDTQGYRPLEEITQLVSESIVIKTSNPNDEWEMLNRIEDTNQ